MSTYLPNSPDFIRQIQPFDSSLNFYAGVLSTKQAQFDQGLKKVNTIYGSLLNSPMTRGDNIERRDQYFKTIQQDIQKVAKMDLSIDQNVASAKTLFDPIINDKHIVKDMMWTKKLYSSYDNAEQYRNCADPEKCGGEYWDTGVQALNYASEEFKMASPDDSLNMQAPSFTPYQNVTKKAIKAAKDAGFNVSYDHVEGRYNVTDTNGQLLLGPDGNSILPQFLYGMFGNDGKVQSMYATQAYVARKNFSKEYAAQHNVDENTAESIYVNEALSKAIPKLNQAKLDNERLRSKLTTDSKMLELNAKQNGTFNGDGTLDAYDRLQMLMAQSDASAQYHENVSNLINTAPNLNNIKALRNRADSIVANIAFKDDMDKAAYAYAMGTSKHEIKADPYAMAAYNSSLDLNKSKQLKDYDFEIWKQQKEIEQTYKRGGLKNAFNLEGTDLWNQLSEKGLTAKKLMQENIPVNPLDWEKADIEKLQRLGLGQSTQGIKEQVRTLMGGEDYTPGFIDNNRVLIDAVDNFSNVSIGYLTDSLENMRKQFQNPDGTTEEEKNTVRQKIKNNIDTILEGTGVQTADVLNNTVSTFTFSNPEKFSRAIGRTAVLQEKDLSSNVITNQWDPKSYAQYQVAKQVAEGLYNERKAGNKAVLESLVASEVANLGQGDHTDSFKKIVLIKSVVGPEGPRLKDQARQHYIAEASKYYNDDEPHVIIEEGEKIVMPGKSAQEKAEDYFDRNFKNQVIQYSNLVPNWKSMPGSSDSGGTLAPNKEVSYTVRGEQKFSPSYMRIENLAKEVPLTSNAIYGQAGVANLAEFKNDGNKELQANKFFEAIRNGDTKDLDFTYKLRNSPSKIVNGEVRPQSVVMEVDLTDVTIHKLYPEFSKDADLTPFKSFVVEIPKAQGSITVDKFISSTTPSTTDIFFRNNGATINQTLPNLGSYNISRQGENLVITGMVKAFDPLKKQIVDVLLETTYLSGGITPQKAIEIGNDMLVYAGQVTAAAKKDHSEQPNEYINGGAAAK